MRLLEKIDSLESHVKELRQYIPDEYQSYKWIVKRAVERLLQICIEEVIDICNLIVKMEKLGVPEGEEDVFDKLEKKGVLDEELGETIRSMKGFRNVLVHRYGQINDKLSFDYAKNNNRDFNVFLKKMKNYAKNR